jgi:hypothetical protein
MARALEGLSAPLSVVQALLADAVAPQSRGSMGFVMVLGGAVALVPLTLVAAGVTVLVGVTIYLSKEVVETARRRRRSKEKCLKMYIECAGMGDPCTRKINRDYNVCSLCQDNCIKSAPYFTSQCTQCGFE